MRSLCSPGCHIGASAGIRATMLSIPCSQISIWCGRTVSSSWVCAITGGTRSQNIPTIAPNVPKRATMNASQRGNLARRWKKSVTAPRYSEMRIARNNSRKMSAALPTIHSSRTVRTTDARMGANLKRPVVPAITGILRLVLEVFDLGVHGLFALVARLSRAKLPVVGLRRAGGEHPHLLLEGEELLVDADRAGALLQPLEVTGQLVAGELLVDLGARLDALLGGNDLVLHARERLEG